MMMEIDQECTFELPDRGRHARKSSSIFDLTVHQWKRIEWICATVSSCTFKFTSKVGLAVSEASPRFSLPPSAPATCESIQYFRHLRLPCNLVPPEAIVQFWFAYYFSGGKKTARQSKFRRRQLNSFYSYILFRSQKKTKALFCCCYFFFCWFLFIYSLLLWDRAMCMVCCWAWRDILRTYTSSVMAYCVVYKYIINAEQNT